MDHSFPLRESHGNMRNTSVVTINQTIKLAVMRRARPRPISEICSHHEEHEECKFTTEPWRLLQRAVVEIRLLIPVFLGILHASVVHTLLFMTWW